MGFERFDDVPQQNDLDIPELQQLLQQYGDVSLIYRGESGEQQATLREALGDPKCPLKDILSTMPFEAQVGIIRPYLEPEQ